MTDDHDAPPVSPEAAVRPDELVAAAHEDGVDAAAAAARRVIDALLLAGDHTDADLTGVAKQLHALADHLQERAPPARNAWSPCGAAPASPGTTR